MRKMIILAVVTAAVMCFAHGAALAGNGYGPGDGSGPLFDCTAGTPFEYTGDVVTAPTVGSGQGMVIATADEKHHHLRAGAVMVLDPGRGGSSGRGATRSP